MENLRMKLGNLWPILLTSLLTFLVTGYIFVGLKMLNPEFAIKFAKDAVSFKNVEKFERVKSLIKDDYYMNVSEDKLLEGAISGMADSLSDPYTVYFTRDEMRNFKEKSEGQYAGVGFSVRTEEGLLTVKETFEDSPAKNAGILPGDKIVKVDGKDVTSIKNEDLIVSMIKGPEGTQVKLNVFRQSEQKFIDFDLVRKKIKIENIKSEVLNGNIGYIKLMMFDNDIAEYFENHLNKLLGRGIKGLIIDLRDNPGGSYLEVIKVSDRILPSGVIVYTQDRKGVKDERFSERSELSMPIVLLVNENSASASEILAGAIKDFKKGTLVGVKTYGKGVVQELKEFDDGSGIKITIARYFTPAGVSIDKKGIVPDIEVRLNEKYKDFPVSMVPRDEDLQLSKAIEVMRDKISQKK